ncbi:hypothetical protein ACIBQX_00930 [Nonomuraea sp. NPDC049714]|uniref:hypothetical protein n=1 Tax=Nonomuraea sp. NPDC049714 TaxID=3364357 RepID=UPI00379ACF04
MVVGTPTAADSEPHSDAIGHLADRTVVGPSSGWEAQVAELARRTTSVAIAGAARSHRSTAADYRHAARIAGPHPAP